jgi:hypothetical protein
VVTNDADNLVSAVAATPDATIEDVSIEALISEYREIRDELSVRRKAYDDYEEAAKGRMDEIAMKLREVADALGLNALPTKAGTAYRTVKEYYRVGNWALIREYVEKTGNWQMLEKRVAKNATKEIHQATGEVPPGVEYSSEVEFVIRKN